MCKNILIKWVPIFECVKNMWTNWFNFWIRKEMFSCAWHFMKKLKRFAQIISSVWMYEGGLQLKIYLFVVKKTFSYILGVCVMILYEWINISYDYPIRNIILPSNHGARGQAFFAVSLWLQPTFTLWKITAVLQAWPNVTPLTSISFSQSSQIMNQFLYYSFPHRTELV